MVKLKKNYLVEKRNVLNEIRANNMTLQELRFFAIYLSKINSREISTRVVRFPMDEFKAIMELGRIDIKYMKNVTNSLLCKVVNVPIVDEKGRNKGYTGFQLFKECTVSQDNSGAWYMEIDAHDKALPLMFEFKRDYFTYPVFNALRLKSPNQIRMYELLRQYQKVGSRIYSIEELKKDLWLGENEYLRFGDFKHRVLDACQQALLEHTDIKFTYEPYGKRGKGGKILNLIFYIGENKDYTDQLTLDMFIDEQIDATEDGAFDKCEDDNWDEDLPKTFHDRIKFLMEACHNEFGFQDVVVLWNDMRKKLPYSLIDDDIQCYDYLNDKYNEMLMRAERTNIPHRHGYLRSIIGKDYEP